MIDQSRYIRKSILYIVTILSFAFLCAVIPEHRSGYDASTSVQEYDWRVVRVFPHDSTAFTQGLIFHDGYLYESTGRRGHSEIRKICLETGEFIQGQSLEDKYFGEGLTAWNDQLMQLTLSSGIGFVYNLHSFERNRTFQIKGDGWGLTSNGKELIMSDGTSALRFLDPTTFQEIRRITVTLNGEPVSKLNELEMIGEKIFTNRLLSDEILIIDSENGEVTGRINLERLVSSVKAKHSVSVLNGIAYDAKNDRIFITGKLWPNIYEIKVWPKVQK